MLYVTDSCGHLLGSVGCYALRNAPPHCPVEALSEAVTVKIPALADREAVVRAFTESGALVLPVVSEDEHLCGIISASTVLKALQSEVDEDFDLISAITPHDSPYLETSVLKEFRARIPWLLLLMLTATFTGMIISSFETALSACVYLTAFIPMLMGTGGNAGSQASVTVIRALSLGEVSGKDVFRILRKELRVALLSALTLSVFSYLKLLLVDHLLLRVLTVEGAIYAPPVVALTLFFTVVTAKLTGAFLPILAKRLGLDPAVMASPFITTAADTVSLMLYFSVARALIPTL